jgi:mono/diheme cytochrome c family protein
MRGRVLGVGTVGLLLSVSVSLSAQKNASPATPTTKDKLVFAELTKAPAKAQSKRNPLEHDPNAVAAGRNLFAQHCSECHGEIAQGGKKAPNLRAEEVQNATPGTIFWILTNGVVRRGMPVWSRLPEPQRWQLVTYIKSLGTMSTPTAPVVAAAPSAQPSPHR